MKAKKFILWIFALIFTLQSYSQSIATGYTVGTWSGFRTSAATFTFDDGCANQATATETLDQYGYKASFYPPTSWVSNWSVFQTRVNNGHEVGSHSVNHGNTMPDSEISESRTIINNNIKNQDCNTITYPNCNEPSESVLKQYYIGGRICNGQVEGPTPSNYYQIGSLICGNAGSYNSLSSFQTAFQTAINKNGWAVFLIHEIDNGNGNASGYSPLSSTVFADVVDYVSQNDSKIWLTTFRNAILYSQERDKLSLTETTKSSTQYTLAASVSITSSIVTYDFPITVRRVMPSGWTNFAASQDGKDIAVTMITAGGKTYAQFDVVPGKTYTLEDRESEYTEEGGEGEEEPENTSTNGISNGEFDSGTSGWAIQNNENAKGTMTAVTNANLSGQNAVSICPDGNSGTEAWHIQMYQNVTLKPNTTYSYTFTAKAASARNLVVMVQKVAADYDTYDWQQFSLTTSAQNFSSSFTTPSDAAADSKIAFCIGGADGCVYIDNVVFNVPSSEGGGGGGGSHYETDACTHTTKLTGGTTLTQSSNGGHNISDNEFNYELWFDGSNGGASMTYFGGDADCAFKASWNNCGDYLARVGFYYGGNSSKTYKDYDNIHAEFNYKDSKQGNGGGSYSYIGVYGWTLVPNEIEFYIVEDSFTPSGGGMYYGSTVVGTYECDGATYTLRVGQRNNAPSISGTSTFKQIFAVRSSFRECGHISVSEHFKQWEANGITLGNMYDCKLLCEVGGGTGSIEYTYATMYYGDPKPEGGDDDDNENPNPGQNPNIEVSGDISKYFIDKAYVGPSCDALDGEEVNGGAYYTGEYTNLFVKYLGKSQADVDKKMQDLWNHFFTVGGQNTVYYETNNNMAYIYDTGNQDVRTEGMSYGLMICVQMGDRDKFDKIWRWAKKYMQYPTSHQKAGLFAWQCNTDGSKIGQDPSCAPDGEMYFLTALWFASHRWGNDGDINYEEEAQYLVKAILDKSGRSSGSICPIFNMGNHIVTFGETSYDFTDPSYNLPGFLELWARWSNTNKDFWAETPVAARGLLKNACNSKSGLFPDYSDFNGQPYKPSWAGYDTKQYKYDASRSAMNVGMDYNWFAADANQPEMMARLLNFFKEDNFQHGYFDWDGGNGSDYYNQAMHGSNGVAVFALKNNESLAKTYVQRLWDATVPVGQWRYYNGMVYFLSMLHASGYFKIYKPMPEIITENLSGPSPVVFNEVEYTKDTTFQALVDCKIYDVTITIEESAATYTVVFEDYNGDELKSEEVEEGQSATAPTEPTRTGYTFKEWDADFTNITENLVVKAVYEINTYKVTFVDYDGSTLKEQIVEYGSDATAPTEPTREGYTFSGWDKTFTNVTVALMVTATYTEKTQADYTALNKAIADAEAIETVSYTTTTVAALQTALTAAKAVDKNLYAESQSVIDAATSALNSAIQGLTVQTFTVTFVDFDDSEIDQQTIQYGEGATAPTEPTRSGYTFAGWDTEFANVTKDLTIKATYNKVVETTKFEAENAVKTTGAEEVQNTIASNGKYVQMKSSESLTFTIPAEKTGMYMLDIVYSLGEDYKAQDLYVNDDKVGSIAFERTTTTNTPVFNVVQAQVYLQEGTNTIALKKSWGWVDIDYVEIHEYERTKLSYSENLVTPNPQPAAIQIYDLLKENYGKNVLSSVMTLTLMDGMSPITLKQQHDVSYIYDASGKYPAAVGFDFMQTTNYDKTNSWFPLYNQSMIDMAKELWKNDGLPMFTWHWRDPTKGTNAFYSGETTIKLADAFTDESCTTWNTSSLLYTSMMEDIDVVAKHLQDLQCEGVSIVWRPLHEASGEWFWWGTSGPEAYKKLWKLLFDKLVNEYHLTNLVWVWTSCGNDADWYPGDAYVDVVGRDMYVTNHGSLATEFEALASLVEGKKIVTLSECGAMPYPENLEKDNSMWSWFMPWYDEGDTKYLSGGEYNTLDDISTVMNDSRTITLDKMPGWDNRTKIYDTTTVGTTYTKYGFSITPTIEGDSENELVLESQIGCDSTIVLYLHANAKDVVEYTVTFVDYDDSEIDVQTVEEGGDATAPTEPTREGYTFSGWDKSFTNVTSDLIVKAQYTEKGKADYTALNKAIADAEAIETVRYTTATVTALQSALTAAKAVDKDLFAESQSIVDAATATLNSAIQALAVQTFIVTFVDFDDSELDQQTINYGESATAPTEPTRDGYTFSGWDKTFTNVTANLIVKAQYTEKGKADYTALNKAIADAEAIETVRYTTTTVTALQSALTAAKAVDKDLFAESQSIVDAATATLNSAIQALAVQTFIVTFVDFDDSELDQQTINYGESATAPTEPTRDGYIFSGWDKTFTNVTANLTVKAQYTEKGMADYTALNKAIADAEAIETVRYTTATVTALQSALTAAKAVDKDLFAESQSVVDAATATLNSAIQGLEAKTFTVAFVADGQTVSTQTVEYGKSAQTPTNPTKTGYNFVKWNGDYSTITTDVQVTAEFEIQTFVVTFVDWNSTELKSETVEYNSNATAPTNPSREGYTFSGWDKAFTNVTTDLTVTAQYTAKGMADYTNLNKAIAQAEAIETVQYTAETIAQLQSALQSAKAVDKNLFEESQSIVDAATTQLQSALSALVKQTFTVEFVVDGETVSSQTVEYGKSAKEPTNPTMVGYTFVQWDTDYTNVTRDLIINAEFEVKTFTVRFVDYDNSEISVQTIAYGEDAVAPKDPIREGYTFTKWSGTYTNVTKNVTITASYTQKAKASYTALDKSIATATNMKESNYSTNSWSTLQQELSKAQALDRNLYVEDQSIVDDANIALQLAISNLEKLDRMTLASTISVANSLYSNAVEGYNKGQYPIGSKAELLSAIEAAKVEYERTSTTQQALNTATATLQAAIDNFKSLSITTDKSQLLMTITKANNAMKRADGNTGAGSGQYPQTAVSAFQAAIDEAQQVYETSASQDMVDNQVIILNDAINAFLESVNPIVVSTEELEKLVAEANSLLNNSRVGDKPGQYPLLEYMSLFTASNTAKDIIAQQNPNEDEIQTQTKVLADLIEVFKNSMIPLAVDDAEADAVSVYAVNHTIYIMYAKDVISVYDNNGRLIIRVDDVDGFDTNPYEIAIQKDGIYYVVIGSESFAVIIK